MEEPQVGAFDRGTVGFWKVSNLLGWSLIALLAAAYFTVAMLSVSTLVDLRYPYGVTDWARFIVFIALPAALLSGGCIGTLVGRHVYRFQRTIACVIAVLNAGLSVFYVDPWFDYAKGKTFFALALLPAVPLAIWVTGHVLGRLPESRRSRLRPPLQQGEETEEGGHPGKGEEEEEHRQES